MPPEILVKNIYIPDCKVSPHASFVKCYLYLGSHLNIFHESSKTVTRLPQLRVHWSADSAFLSRGCRVTSTVMNKQVNFLRQETISIIFNAKRVQDRYQI